MVPTVSCSHQDASPTRRICLHLLGTGAANYYRRFAGPPDYDLICEDCARRPEQIESSLCRVCEPCFDKVEEDGCWVGIVGRPDVLERPTTLHFAHQTVELPGLNAEDILEIQPLDAATGSTWVVLTRTGGLVRLDLANRTCTPLAQLPPLAVDLEKAVSLYLSAQGELAAVVNTLGQFGLVMDLEHGRPTMPLKRDTYHIDVTPFAVAFFQHQGRPLLVHAATWNRLDISDPWTGELLTPRTSPSYKDGEPEHEHYLDYFHGRLRVSPNQERIAEDGWVWHPMGFVVTWSLNRWIDQNRWESEDGASKKSLCWRAYFWDGPLCWIDDKTLAVWGYGEDDECLLPAARLFDVETGKELRWFAGPDVEFRPGEPWSVKPADALVFDTYLFSFSTTNGTSVWDIVTGERLLRDSSFCPLRYHHGAKQFLTLVPGRGFQASSLEG